MGYSSGSKRKTAIATTSRNEQAKNVQNSQKFTEKSIARTLPIHSQIDVAKAYDRNRYSNSISVLYKADFGGDLFHSNQLLYITCRQIVTKNFKYCNGLSWRKRKHKSYKYYC